MKSILPIAALSLTLMSGCVINRPQPVVVSDPAPVTVYRPGYVVTTLPAGSRTVRVNRSVYYVDRDVYYRENPAGGYVVVDRPR